MIYVLKFLTVSRKAILVMKTFLAILEHDMEKNAKLLSQSGMTRKSVVLHIQNINFNVIFKMNFQKLNTL